MNSTSFVLPFVTNPALKNDSERGVKTTVSFTATTNRFNEVVGPAKTSALSGNAQK